MSSAWSSEIPNGVVVWRRAQNLAKIFCEDLKKLVEPPKMALEKWKAQWFDLYHETSQNESQWRALICYLNVAG